MRIKRYLRLFLRVPYKCTTILKKRPRMAANERKISGLQYVAKYRIFAL